MPSGIVIRSKEVVKTPLPELKVGINPTKSSAIHRKRYVGHLVYWDSFEREAWLNSQGTPWGAHQKVLAYRPKGHPANASHVSEEFCCGDEGSVQGRFGSNLGQVLSSVCSAMNVDICFGDYKAVVGRNLQGKVPDVACITGQGQMQIVGEIKAPWEAAHDLEETIYRGGKDLEVLLGQISTYMRKSGLKYGFLSTYNQTVFLKQEFRLGQWELWHTDAIYHSTTAGEPAGGSYVKAVTLRECFWRFIGLAQVGHQAVNQVPMAQWVVPLRK